MSELPFKVMLDGLLTYVGLSYAYMEGERKTVVFDFSVTGFGFGELTLVQEPSGLYVDSECILQAGVNNLLRLMLETATYDTDKDPIKHRRYNEAMHRTCGESCRVCHPEPSP